MVYCYANSSMLPRNALFKSHTLHASYFIDLIFCIPSLYFLHLSNQKFKQDDTIDDRVVNRMPLPLDQEKIFDNLHLCLNSCKAIGCHVVDITVEKLYNGDVAAIHLVLWELIRVCYSLKYQSIMF